MGFIGSIIVGRQLGFQSFRHLLGTRMGRRNRHSNYRCHYRTMDLG